jgi:hypothetical protein
MHNTKLYNSLVLILILSIFSACASRQSSTEEIQTPPWVKTPPKDNENFIYGVGIAKTKDKALKEALANIVTQLQTKVKSSFTNQQILSGYYSKSISSSDIKKNITKIKVRNYSIDKTEEFSNLRYYILVKVDKKGFYKTLKEDIKNSKKSIVSKLENSASMNVLKRFKIKKSIIKECDALLSTSLVAYELDNSFDKTKYFNFVSDVKDDYYSELNSLRFFISADADAKVFAQVIKKQLRTNDFTVVDDKEMQSLKIYVKTTDNILRKKQNVKIKLLIEVVDAQEVLASNTIMFKQSHNGSKKEIYNLAAKDFAKDVESMEIENILGIGKK